ncbi:MAG: box helicase [Gammaproteobacteria bacterium]|jgi:predicted helicase|nr:box helicase [Gammaproteobacteria bacterium]
MRALDLLLTILNHSFNWNDIHTKLLNYSSSQKSLVGKVFEEFCKYYYLVEPTVKHDYRNVWLFSEIPHSVKKKLNIGKIDHGVDLVLEGYDGTFSTVQCKFRKAIKLITLLCLQMRQVLIDTRYQKN